MASSFPPPDNLAMYPNIVAMAPASTIPPIVPKAAEMLFLFQPAIIAKVNTVIIKQVPIETNIALYPLNIAASNTKNTANTVIINPIMPLFLFFFLLKLCLQKEYN